MAMLATLRPDSWRVAACDLSTATEQIIAATVSNWPRPLPGLNKRPTVFIVEAR